MSTVDVERQQRLEDLRGVGFEEHLAVIGVRDGGPCQCRLGRRR